MSAPWFVPGPRAADALPRLFCFAHAGGSAHAFRGWQQLRQRDVDAIDIWAVELPGRGRRAREPLIGEMPQLVAQLADAIAPHLDQPYALLGHSMGGRIAFELAAELQKTRLPQPLFVCPVAMRAPHFPARHAPVHQMTPEQVKSELLRMGGTPVSLLDDQEMFDRFIFPVVRSDYRLLETLPAYAGPPLRIPIAALVGKTDLAVNQEELDGWARHTTAGFTSKWYPGGHFFLHERTAELVAYVRTRLAAPGPRGC